MSKATLSYCMLSDNFNRYAYNAFKTNGTELWSSSGGTWVVGDPLLWLYGYLQQTVATGTSILYVPSSSFTNFVYRAKMWGSGSSLLFRVTAPNNWYAFNMDTDGTVRLYKDLAGSITQIGTNSETSLTGSQWHDWKINADGATFVATIDGTTSQTRTDVSSPILTGSVGFKTSASVGNFGSAFLYDNNWGNKGVWWTNFFLTDYVRTEDMNVNTIKIPAGSGEVIQRGGVGNPRFTITGKLTPDSIQYNTDKISYNTNNSYYHDVGLLHRLRDNKKMVLVESSDFTASGVITNINYPKFPKGTKKIADFSFDMIECSGPCRS